MERRAIGTLEVSLAGLGCNNFGFLIDAARAREVVGAALDAGVTFFDIADVYGAGTGEEMLGAALRGRRDRVVIATKFGGLIGGDKDKGGASAAWIRQAVDGSLRRLGTDYIDLYQQHHPDPDVPVEETLTALDDLVRAGKVREVGCSNFSVAELDDALEAAAQAGLARFASVQNELSLLRREQLAGVLPACDRDGVRFLPFFPLASGVLTGKYRRGAEPPEGSRLAAMPAMRPVLSDATFSAVGRLAGYAADHGRTLLDLALAWLAAFPAVASVIAGATSPEQVLANATAIGWDLTPDQRDEVTRLAAGP